MAAPVKKGEVAAIITTTVTHYGFGSGRKPTTSHNIQIVRCAAATRDGLLRKYQTHAESPTYPFDTKLGRHKVMCIGGEMQANAMRLFLAAKDPTSITYSDQEAAKAAIRAA